ncbi:hypothetical protein D3C85_1712380 [compost metagenome]
MGMGLQHPVQTPPLFGDQGQQVLDRSSRGARRSGVEIQHRIDDGRRPRRRISHHIADGMGRRIEHPDDMRQVRRGLDHADLLRRFIY